MLLSRAPRQMSFVIKMAYLLLARLRDRLFAEHNTDTPTFQDDKYRVQMLGPQGQICV